MTTDAQDAARPAPAPDAAAVSAPSRWLFTVLAVATGALAANLYYAQPLIALIGPELHIPPELAGTLVSVTQIGYGLGLFFLVSLADLVESKRQVMIMLGITALALVTAATANNVVLFFAASLVIGLCSTGAQVLVPFAAHLVPEARRGRTVGNVMAGLLTGILLARPLSLFVSSAVGWRPVFWISAAAMVVIGVLLASLMPRHRPKGGMSYAGILSSMAALMRDTPVLRRRALYQAMIFATFNMLWTAAPLMLADRFGLDQKGIAIFALAGAGGALAAPLAGRLADRGLAQLCTGLAMVVLAIGFLLSCWGVAAGALVGVAVLAVLIDAAVQFNQIISQRILFLLPGESRGRVNALYMTTSFFGGAVGSTLATATYHAGGWTATAGTAAGISIVCLMFFLTEFRRKPA
ncbi:MAG TPA: MFS transporter [Devosia sp.]|nr:MFS transporter [Devosia sp.]